MKHSLTRGANLFNLAQSAIKVETTTSPSEQSHDPVHTPLDAVTANQGFATWSINQNSNLFNSPLDASDAFSANQGTTSKTAAGSTSTAVVAAGGITFDLKFDAAATAAPQSFRDGIEKAASILSSLISDKITVNLNIDYSGTGGGAAAGPDAGYYESYSLVRSKLVGDATPGDNIFNALPNANSIQGQTNVAVWDAQMKALGLINANDTSTDDGTAYFATDIGSNLLVGVALHELTHALGRVPYGSAPDIFDLFRFTSNGNRLFSGGATAPAAYFSIDGGATKLADFGQTSDPSDFLNKGVQGANDPFNEFYNAQTSQTLSKVDLQLLDALGFHPTAPAPQPDLTVSGLGLTSANSVTVTLNNIGAGQAGASTTGLYLSTHATPTTADTLIGSFNASALQAGASQTENIAVTLPTNLANGTYYVAAIADSKSVVTESNETNNISNTLQIVVDHTKGGTISGANALLLASGGSETIKSTGGNDIMVGAGNDTLIGGTSGNDQFVFNAVSAGNDKVSNFHAGDHFDFAAAGFGNGLATGHANTGVLDATHFFSGATTPTAATPGFFFNTSNHTLYFEAVNSTHENAMAQLQNTYVLHNTDILLV